MIHQSKDSTLTLCLSCAIPSRCNKCSEKALKRPLPTQLGTSNSKILRNHYYKVTISNESKQHLKKKKKKKKSIIKNDVLNLIF